MRRFNRACAAVGLAFLLIEVMGKYALYEHRGIVQTADFGQYYMGGVMALHGEWDALYPVPRAGAVVNAGFPDGSDLRPAYRRRAVALGVDVYIVRFMQPPPCALLFVPLAMLPLKVALPLWELLLIAATLGVAMQAAEMLELSLGNARSGLCHPERTREGSGLGVRGQILREYAQDDTARGATKLGGVLILLICCSPQAFRWVRVANLSVVVAWLIGYATLELVRRDGARGAAALVIGTVIKYALLVLLPLVAAARRWRTLAWTVVLGLATLLVSLMVMGAAPFKTFAFDIAPTLGRTSLIGENQALYRFLLDVQGLDRENAMPRPVEIGFRVAQFSILGLMLALIATKPAEYWETPSHVFAAALALVAWLLIFSPIFWEHYHAYFAPFWGWLAYEAMRSRTKCALVILAIALAYMPSSVILKHLHWPKLPQPLFSHLLWSAVIMFGLAMWELLGLRGFQPAPEVDSEPEARVGNP